MGTNGGLFSTHVLIFRFVIGILHQLSFLVRNLITWSEQEKKNGSHIPSLFVMPSCKYLEFNVVYIIMPQELTMFSN
jgi:lipid-A-disaccharide synthase-like uncharacterized protein